MLNFDRSIIKHGTQNIQNDCHQWLSDSFRVHQIRFRPGLRPGPHWESLDRSSDPLAGLTYSFVCVIWRIVASMALRHRTLLRHFSRRLMYKDVVVSGLLRRLNSYHRHVEPSLVIVRFRLVRRVPGILFQLRSGKSMPAFRRKLKTALFAIFFSGRLTVI